MTFLIAVTLKFMMTVSSDLILSPTTKMSHIKFEVGGPNSSGENGKKWYNDLCDLIDFKIQDCCVITNSVLSPSYGALYTYTKSEFLVIFM